MLSKPVLDAINNQIQKEFESAYLYLGMAAHFDAITLPGFAKWMRKQFEEEQGHALKFYEYVNDQRGEVVLQLIAAPPAKFGKPIEIFEQVLAHEQKVTASIKAIHELAAKEGDQATQIALQWFLTEQVEEEKNAADAIERLKMGGEMPFGLLFLDQHVFGNRK
jgi:ferritin